MAAALRRVLAIGICFFCISVSAYCLPNTTVVCKICNRIKIPTVSYGSNVYRVLDDLAQHTSSEGYNYYTQASEAGPVCYGHAACAGHLSAYDCFLCLATAQQDLVFDCPQDIGAQEQLKDCRMRYENYPFQE